MKLRMLSPRFLRPYRLWAVPLSLTVAFTLQAAPTIAAVNRSISADSSQPNQGTHQGTKALATLPEGGTPANRASQKTGELARIALISTILATLAAFLGYRLGSRAKQSVRTLSAIAQRLQANRLEPEDLQHLNALANQGDHVGELAKVLREMTEGTHEREQALSSQIARLQAQVRTKHPQAAGLEMAYYDALCKKSAWLRQQISQR